MKKVFLMFLMPVIVGLIACQIPDEEPENKNTFHFSIGSALSDDESVAETLVETGDGGLAFLVQKSTIDYSDPTQDQYLVKTDATGNILLGREVKCPCDR